jgi:hypothetical protein
MISCFIALCQVSRNKFICNILPAPNIGVVTAIELIGIPALLAVQILLDRFQVTKEAGAENSY